MAIDSACACGSIGRTDGVRLCIPCHRYWRNDQELLSVSHVLKSVWPFKPNFAAAPLHVIANARHRGVVVDRLFSGYLNGDLKSIPIGTRTDSVRLFWKLKRWWSDHKHSENVRAQVILADHEVAGTCDIVDDDAILDLKTTYKLEPHYELQLGAYATLFYATFGRQPKKAGLIHLTQRFPAPKLHTIDLIQSMIDWCMIRDAYFMAKRRSRK